MAKATSVKSSSDRKEASLELWAISFRYSTNTCLSVLQFYQQFFLSCNIYSIIIPSCLAILSAILDVCCISSKTSYSCTVQGRGIPLRGLRIVLRQFILTHVVNF